MTQDVEDYDHGYDPTVREPFPTETPRFLDRLPRAAIVNPRSSRRSASRARAPR
jgi:hypothetical protein